VIVTVENNEGGRASLHVDEDMADYLRSLVAKGDLVSVTTEDEPEAGAQAPADGRPRVNDPKADWVAYAVAQGADPVDAEKATKAELAELYGGEG
jgi:hypothetical protein